MAAVSLAHRPLAYLTMLHFRARLRGWRKIDISTAQARICDDEPVQNAVLYRVSPLLRLSSVACAARCAIVHSLATARRSRGVLQLAWQAPLRHIPAAAFKAY